MVLFRDFGKIWVFNEVRSRFPGALFSRKELAEEWIAKHKLSGTLTLYPLDEGVYDLFVKQGWFRPKKQDHYEPQFIGSFTQASQDHEHFEDGKNISEIARESRDRREVDEP